MKFVQYKLHLWCYTFLTAFYFPRTFWVYFHWTAAGVQWPFGLQIAFYTDSDMYQQEKNAIKCKKKIEEKNISQNLGSFRPHAQNRHFWPYSLFVYLYQQKRKKCQKPTAYFIFLAILFTLAEKNGEKKK